MPAQTYTITQLTNTLNPGFTIKQIKIENPTPFYLYVNISTIIPTGISSDYTVQPNSTLITPEVNNTNMCVVAAGVNVSKGVAKVTVYDSAQQQAGTIPYQTSQFVGNFPNYPYTIPASNTTSDIALPDINIDKFQTIFIQMAGDADYGIFGAYHPIFIGIVIPNSLTPTSFFLAGGFSPLGGVVSFVPSSVPATLSPRVDNRNGVNSYNRIFNVIQTGDIIDTNYNPPDINIGLANGATGSIYGYFNSPGFVFSMTVQNNKAGAFNAVFDLEVGIGLSYGSQIYSPLYVASYNLPVVNFGLVNVINKVFIHAGIGEVRIKVTNNSGATNDLIFWPLVNTL